MTRKHFQMFAEEIKHVRGQDLITEEQAKAAARVVANVALQVSKTFNPDRFFDACGLSNVEDF